MSDHIESEQNESTSYSSFYGIITEDVLSSKKILPECKLLFVKLTMMVNTDTGYAFPSNKFLANYFNVDESTIKRWLKILKDNEFIYIILEKIGMKTYRKIYINMNSKNIPKQLINKLVDGSTVSWSTSHQRAPTNISKNTNIKNPPPPSSKSSLKKEKPKEPSDPKPKESLRSEEEEFFEIEEKKQALGKLPLGMKDIIRLCKWTLPKLLEAIEIFNSHEVKKNAMGMMLNILTRPTEWSIKPKVKTKEEKDKELEEYREKNKSLSIKMADMYKGLLKIWQDSVVITCQGKKCEIFYFEENFEEVLYAYLKKLG